MTGGQLHSRKLAIANYCESICNQFISNPLQFLCTFLCVSPNNVCLSVPTFCFETQYNQKLYPSASETRWRRTASAIYNWEFVCLFTVNAKTTERIDAKRSEITKNDPESVLRRLKSPALVLSGRYRKISGFFAANRHFYLSSVHFRLLPRWLTQSAFAYGVDRASHRYVLIISR